MFLTLKKRQLVTLLVIIGILFVLPLVIMLSQRRQEIRPKAALPGVANFLLNADTTSITPGGNVNVMVSMQLTDPTVRSSAVDFILLYDRNLLKLVNISPNLSGGFSSAVKVIPASPFTSEVAYTGEGGLYNYVNVSLVSFNTGANLPSGTIPLANITFQGKSAGSATIKYPDDNSKIQVVGTVF